MRLEQLTFTRFIAAIAIVIFHYGKYAFPFNNDNINFLFIHANICVSYFFTLSGFVMMIAYYSKSEINKVEYYKNRLARIYPVYLLALFLVIIIPILTSSINIKELLMSVFMLQAWVPKNALSINPPGWSLSVELFFYVLFPFLFNHIYKRLHYKTIAFYIISIWLITQLFIHLMLNNNFFNGFQLKINFIYYFPIFHLNEFLIGNLAGLYFLKNPKQEKKNDWQIIALIAILILTIKFSSGLIYTNGLLALIFIPLIITISINKGFIGKIFKSKICVFLGEISFGIYILQFMVWITISDYRLKKYFHIDKNLDLTLAFFIRLFALIFIAALSYIFFETPIRNKIKKITIN